MGPGATCPRNARIAGRVESRSGRRRVRRSGARLKYRECIEERKSAKRFLEL